jgi:hypothetical protein
LDKLLGILNVQYGKAQVVQIMRMSGEREHGDDTGDVIVLYTSQSAQMRVSPALQCNSPAVFIGTDWWNFDRVLPVAVNGGDPSGRKIAGLVNAGQLELSTKRRPKLGLH